MFIRHRMAGLMLAGAAAAGLAAAVLPASASASATGYVLIANAHLGSPNAYLCLQPADPAAGAGTAVVQQPCNTISNERWTWPSGFAGGRPR